MSVTNDINHVESAAKDGLSKRERRKAESRERLMTAARKLFVEHGYHETRPQDISREAGVGYGTFYLYFADKRECFQAFVSQTHGEIQALVQPELAKCRNGAERVYAALKVAMEYSESNPGVLRAAWAGHQLMSREDGGSSESIVDEWAKAWAVAVRNAQRSGMAWADYDPEIIGRVILMITSVVTMPVNGSQEDKEHYLRNVTQFVVRALAAPDCDGKARIVNGPDADGVIKVEDP